MSLGTGAAEQNLPGPRARARNSLVGHSPEPKQQALGLQQGRLALGLQQGRQAQEWQ